jgi:hypothetical protein
MCPQPPQSADQRAASVARIAPLRTEANEAASAAGAVPTARTRPGLALGVTLAVQAVCTLCMTAPSVMAPVVAPMLGLPAQRIGWFVGLA